jgi:hypothetical protein
MKNIVRSFIEFATGFVKGGEFLKRLVNIKNNRINNINELMAFDRVSNVPSTFFLGVNTGKGLNYNLEDSSRWLREIHRMGFDIGVHGIAFDDPSMICFEHDLFEKITGVKDFGIRMHYLRSSQRTVHYLLNAGYLFDASAYDLQRPYKCFDGFWEFPLQIMDAHIFHHNEKWQNLNLGQMISATTAVINHLIEKKFDYCSILFHDCFFNDAFKTKKDWYMWLIRYLKQEGFEFINYRDAIKELR